MSYFGNQPTTGGENSFKILDDISSYTLTFDGSSASVVSVANDTITQNIHRFITGQRVTYSTTGTTIGGLTSGTAYYIIKNDQNTFKLATTRANALNSISIDLSGLGAGTTHTFNAAFDGVNTKFKATYDNGNKAQITRAAQLQISINGVIQRPFDTSSPPDGFGIDGDSTIVFSTPPVNTDIFWGNVLANNFPTFDISDNTIDTFTGNGSSVNFSLSKIPANSQNILVTLNGVVQYPSDATATRAYSVSGNVLVFVSPPGSGVLIQVRHIGFAGATSSNVTGFYGRTGNVALNTSDDINVGRISTIGDINSVGVVTVRSLSIDSTQVISSARQLQNIASLDATTTATIESAVANAPNTFTDLQVTGVSTFTNGPVLIGSGTSTGTASQRLQVTGGGYISDSVGIGTTLGITDYSNSLTIKAAASDLSALYLWSNRSGSVNHGAIYFYNQSKEQISAILGSGTTTAPVIRMNLTGSDIARFTPAGLLVGSASSTGTLSQPLQVTGGAYVSGSLGVAITNPTSRLHVVGDAIVTGVITATDFNSTSDIKLKTNIQTIESPLSKVMQLNGVSFNWKENNKPSLGVIAQEVEEVLPELVNGDDPKTVNYNGLIGLLIECIKEQQHEINTLKEKL